MVLAVERAARLRRVGLVEPERPRLGVGVGAADGLGIHGRRTTQWRSGAEGEGFEPPGP